MEEQKPLFTQAEWNQEVPKVVRAMHDYLGHFAVPISKHLGDHGELWGTGTYLELGGRTFILTNEHVAREREKTQLLHQMQGQDNLHFIRGNHASYEWPLDVAVLPVAETVWQTAHTAKAITIDLISIAHSPAPTELLTFAGFSPNFPLGKSLSD